MAGGLSQMNAEAGTTTELGIDDAKYRRRYWTLGVLSVSLIIIALDITVLNVAIPTLQRELDASASALHTFACRSSANVGGRPSLSACGCI
jgi:hypothetical protein